ncbi:MAG TPA: tyrosine-type recombinase/integrase [Usitatibacter sp.]|jgi:site-specific recombinase XerD|nr:tyrosine-type recombinase/integrase [Usitatibacter sp.]
MASAQHLKKRGERWYLRLAIPRKLRHLYPTESGKPSYHIEEALGTPDLNVANRLKHERIAHWVRDFHEKERAATGTLTPDAAEAQRLREHFRKANDASERETIADHVASIATDMHESGAPERAQQFHALATATETLRDSWGKWKREWRITKAGEYKYEQAFRELLEFLGVADTTPKHITPARARAYVAYLNTDAKSAKGEGSLSKATKEGRLSPLRTFWTEYLIPSELAEVNPWKDHKLTEGGNAVEKRPYTNDEIIALINGPERRETKDVRYTKRTILELYALAFYTGARREEIACRLLGDFERIKGGYVMHIREAKTNAGKRSIPILHPIPVAVIGRRIGKRKDAKAQLFEEFKRGGANKTLGDLVGKMMTFYRRASGVGAGADFHSTRRHLITQLVAQGHSRELVQFYVGHKVPGMTGIYAKPTDEGMRKIAKSISYPATIERGLRGKLDLA